MRPRTANTNVFQRTTVNYRVTVRCEAISLCIYHTVVNNNVFISEQSVCTDHLELTVAASEGKVVMIEAGAKEVSDEVMFDAIMKAHEECKGIVKFINEIVAEIGKPKFAYASGELDHDMFDEIFAYCEERVMEALDTDDKTVRDAKMQPIMDDIVATFEEKETVDGTEQKVDKSYTFYATNMAASKFQKLALYNR